MPASSQNYLKIKSLLQQNLSTREDKDVLLNRMKNVFKSDIKSPRKLERIQSLSELINTLEKRYCISEKRINHLEVITDELGNPGDVCRIINNYKNSIAFGIDMPHKRALYDVLVQGLGRHYRDFARYLGMEESQLETIDMTYPSDITSRIWKLLDVCENEHNTFDLYFKNICNALKKCRRIDLMDKVISIKQSEN